MKEILNKFKGVTDIKGEKVAVRDPNKPDNLQTRMERWEKANHRQMKDLSPEEWVRVVNNIGCMTGSEAWDLYNSKYNL